MKPVVRAGIAHIFFIFFAVTPERPIIFFRSLNGLIVINAEFENLLSSVKPENAEAFYAKIYTKCQVADLRAGAGLDLFHGLVNWQQRQTHPVLQSYGFLYLSALIDSDQIEPTSLPAETIVACVMPFLEKASAHQVLSPSGYFIHFMNHMVFFVAPPLSI